MNLALIDTYSKEDLVKLVNESSCLRELIKKLGYKTCNGSNGNTVKKRLNKYNIDCSHFNKNIKKINWTEDTIFTKDSKATQKVLRSWFVKGNYTKYECSICGLKPIWCGKALTLILDHINGINNDDRLENLRWVCPNCNQQLPTTGFKNHVYQKNHLS